jgi:tetratricopeptide (TPR) repeat protein
VRLLSRLAGLRERQGRPLETERLCRDAIPEAERVGERRALAYLCVALDTALMRSRRLEEPTNWMRALEIYRELDDPENESTVLNNIAGIAHMDGRWDEVVDLLEQAAECGRRAGSPADAAFSDLNIGEVRSDQGRLDEAGVHLRRALRVFRATGERQLVAAVTMKIGRNTIRQGEPGAGLKLIEQAASDLRGFGIDVEANEADGLLAEAEALAGSAERALHIADRLLGSWDVNSPLLLRVRALALARLGDDESSKHQLELAAAARERGELYELALALDALERVDGSSPDRERERDAILKQLGVLQLPAVAGHEGRPTAGRTELVA